MKRPFLNPEVELAALCSRELVLHEQVKELCAIGESVPGTPKMIEISRIMLEECRAAISKFKVVHKLQT